MKLWLARHARPDCAEGLCYGASDIPAGHAQTLAAAAALAEALPAAIGMRCSPLRRCVQLQAQLCVLRPDLACLTDPRLAEMNFGDWEGQRWDAVDTAALKAWTDDFSNYRPGAGESVSAFLQRVGQAFDEVRAVGDDVVWITHAGVVRAANLLAVGQRVCEVASQWPVAAPAFGQWQVLELARVTAA